MKKRPTESLLRRITEEVIREITPDYAERMRRFTKAARKCGLSSNQLRRIYLKYWAGGMDSNGFARLILSGRLVHSKDAMHEFYGTDHRNWYRRKNGTTYYFRGPNKGKVAP